MTKAKQVEVRQSPEAPVPAEVMADAVVRIADAAQRLLGSGLTKEALALLINHNIQASHRPGVRTIELVLESAASLDNFLMPKGGG